MKDYADVVRPMYNMLKDNASEYWKKKQQVAFDILKNKLTSILIRVHSNFDKSFKLYTDASDMRLKAVLA